jgi:hypothetical protein
MMFKEIISVCSENHTEPILHSLGNRELLNVRPGGTKLAAVRVQNSWYLILCSIQNDNSQIVVTLQVALLVARMSSLEMIPGSNLCVVTVFF